jgi:hypothetical protein
MDFSKYLLEPMVPPAWMHERWRLEFPQIGGFLIIGEETEDFNCLGWAVQQIAFIGDCELYTELLILGLFMRSYGYELTLDESLSDVDVWGLKIESPTLGQDGNVVGMESKWIVEHFSLKTADGWSSKLGSGPLILHDRYALEDVPGLPHLDGHHYGHVIAHFTRVVPVEQVSQLQQLQVQEVHQTEENEENEETREYEITEITEETQQTQWTAEEYCWCHRCIANILKRD